MRDTKFSPTPLFDEFMFKRSSCVARLASLRQPPKAPRGACHNHVLISAVEHSHIVTECAFNDWKGLFRSRIMAVESAGKYVLYFFFFKF